MAHLDNRVRYTKMVLQQALLKIMQAKDIDKITIKELCEEAQINRGTFYLHYQTPNDLLMEIEQEFIDEKLSLFHPYFDENYETDALAKLFRAILQNQDFCRVTMGKHGNPRFIDRLRMLMRTHIVDGWCKEFPAYDREQLDYVYDFVFTGAMRLLLNWIDEDSGITADQLANRLDRQGHYCHLAIKEFR